MHSLKDLIMRHSKDYSDFLYYLPIIEKAERNEVDHPDITIECCASLFQGVSKSIVYRLDSACDREKFENDKLQHQVKTALKCLKQNDDVIEDEFLRAAGTLALVAGTLRNARGDISHGRASPKELQSDTNLARVVLNITESVVRYMLASYFTIKPQEPEIIAYDAEDNLAFNDYLDEQNPMNGKPLYSLALYQQYYQDYIIELEEFLEQADKNDPA